MALKSYEAIYQDGKVAWVSDRPTVASACIIIVTVPEEVRPAEATVVRRSPPKSIAGKGKTLDGLVSSIVPEADWECLN
ncbi:MAG: hypothetical protein AAGG53_09545 [Cyanobacteria bacterium P01_H01_bin.152]